MISAKTILMAQPIVKEMIKTKNLLGSNIGNITKGLNGESFGGFKYGLGTVVGALPEVTRNDTRHTELLENTAVDIAEKIREAFYDIKTYISPISTTIVNKFYDRACYDNSAHNTIFSEMQLNFRYSDLEILDNERYPTKVDNNFLDYSSVELDDLIKGIYPAMSSNDIVEFCKTNDPELNELVSECDDYILSLYYSFFIAKTVFSGTGYNPKVNFLTEFDDPKELFAFYIFLSKLYTSDVPLANVTGVELSDYRSGISGLRYCVTAALVEVRNKHLAYQKLKCVLKYTTTPTVERIYDVFEIIRGPVSVYITKAFVKELESKNISTSEVVGGYLIGRYIDKSYDEFKLSEVEKYKNSFYNCARNMSEHILIIQKNVLVAVINESLDLLQKNNPKFKDIIGALNSELDYCKLSKFMQQHHDLIKDEYHRYRADNVGDVGMREFLIGSEFMVILMKTLGMGLSACLIEHSVITSDDGVEKRKALTSSVIKTILESQLNCK